MTKKYRLIRFFDVPPFDRYAMTIEHDPSTPDGFRVTSSDPDVATAEFTAQVAQAMHTPHTVISNGERVAYYPGGEGHFDCAVRHIPGAVIGSRK